MDTTKRIKNNKLLADFTGTTVREFGKLLWMVVDEEDLIDFQYDEIYAPDYDWNQLMDIVDNIEELDYEVVIEAQTTKICTNSRRIVQEVIRGSKLGNTYRAVLEFVKWYNENKEK